jgi:hypothetical protein
MGALATIVRKSETNHGYITKEIRHESSRSPYRFVHKPITYCENPIGYSCGISERLLKNHQVIACYAPEGFYSIAIGLEEGLCQSKFFKLDFTVFSPKNKHMDIKDVAVILETFLQNEGITERGLTSRKEVLAEICEILLKVNEFRVQFGKDHPLPKLEIRPSIVVSIATGRKDTLGFLSQDARTERRKFLRD